MTTFTYRTATDEELAARHCIHVDGEEYFDFRMVSIMCGADQQRIKHMAADPSVLTSDDQKRGYARRETVEIKLGRDATPFDVVREFGDEDLREGRIDLGVERDS